MTDCARIRERLDDRVDGTLSPEVAREVEAHLAACPACRAEADALEALVADLAALPTAIEPPERLRREIDRRLDAPTSTGTPTAPTAASRAGRWGLAAAALLLLAVAVRLALPLGGGSADDAPPAPGAASGPAAVPAAGAAPGAAAAERDPAVAEAERALLRARHDLATALDARRDNLPPETLRLVEDNLQVIETAIRKIDAALADEPGNPDLERMRVAYRRQELALLERANRAASRM